MVERRLKWMAASFAAIAIAATAPMTMRQAAAQGAGAQQTLIEQGHQTYAENCSHCHGPNMVNAGTIIPDLRRFPGDKTEFFDTVKHGKNNRMPPWGDILNDDQIAGLWAYISSQRKP